MLRSELSELAIFSIVAEERSFTRAGVRLELSAVSHMMRTLERKLGIQLSLFNPQSGRLDAARIAREIYLPVSAIADAIGKKAPSVRKHPDASSLQAELRRVYRIWVAIVELCSGDKKNARIFLNAPTSTSRTEPLLRSSRAGASSL